MPGTYKERITSIPPSTPILWKSEDSAPSHKARTEILTSLCQNVLTLNVKKLILVLTLNAGPNAPPTHTPPPPPHTDTQKTERKKETNNKNKITVTRT